MRYLLVWQPPAVAPGPGDDTDQSGRGLGSRQIGADALLRLAHVGADQAPRLPCNPRREVFRALNAELHRP